MSMKRVAAFLAILILGASLATAQTSYSPSTRFSNPLLNDVVRMSKAGMPNDTIVSYVRARESRLNVSLTADDLIELRRAGVGEPVIHYLASVASFDAGGGAPQAQATYDSREGETVAVDPGYGGGYAYAYPYYGWGWGWPYYGWWGGPYFSGSVFIGGRFGHRGFGGGRGFHRHR